MIVKFNTVQEIVDSNSEFQKFLLKSGGSPQPYVLWLIGYTSWLLFPAVVTFPCLCGPYFYQRWNK